MELTTVARPYARAAFACAGRKTRAEWAARLAQLAEIIGMPEVAGLLDNPRYPRRQVAEVLLELLDRRGGARPSAERDNLVYLLAERGRLRLLPEIAALFARYVAKSERRIDVEAVSAQALDDAQQAALRAAFERRTGKKVRIHCRVDPSLLGGAIVRADGMVIDGSLRHRLRQLAATLNA